MGRGQQLAAAESSACGCGTSVLQLIALLAYFPISVGYYLVYAASSMIDMPLWQPFERPYVG